MNSNKLRAAALLFFAFIPAVFTGCGKAGMPEPHDPSKSFKWEKSEAHPKGKCLAFTGSFSGAYENLEDVRLELAPVNGPEDCPGCPFVPNEVLLFSRAEAGFNADNGEIGFSYCPRPSKAYRWRLSGVSRYSALPHTMTEEKLVIME